MRFMIVFVAACAAFAQQEFVHDGAGVQPVIVLGNNNGAANQKFWDIAIDGPSLFFRGLNDDFTTYNVAQFNRDVAGSVSALSLFNPTAGTQYGRLLQGGNLSIDTFGGGATYLNFYAGTGVHLSNGAGGDIAVANGTAFNPGSDNAITLGTTGVRWASAGIVLLTVGTITGSSATTPLTIQGATATNGNIVLQPGNVGLNSSVVVQGTRTDVAAMYITEPAGSTSGYNAFEIRNSGGTPVFKIIGDGDIGSGAASAVITKNVVSLAGLTYSLGFPTNRWSIAYVRDVDTSGSVFMNGSAPNIDARSGSGALQLLGASTTNGNVLIQPGNVFLNSSFIVQGQRTDSTLMYLQEPFGATSGYNAFEVRNGFGTPVFKIIGDGDIGSGAASAVITKNVIGLSGSTYTLGFASNRWANYFGVSQDVSGGTVSANGLNAPSTTITVLNGVGSPCTITFTLGWRTGGTC